MIILNSEQLNYIAYLAQVNSLTQVADHFFTSHQVVKKAITSLENELNVSLLRSTNQGTQLTPAGLCVASFVPHFSAQYREMQEALKQFQTVKPDTILPIHFYITPAMSNDCYLNLFHTYSEQHPQIKLITHFVPFPQMLDEIQTEENNIYLSMTLKDAHTISKLKRTAAKHHLKPIFLNSTHSYVCMHKNSKYAKLRNPTLDDFHNDIIYMFMHSNPFCTDNTLSTNHSIQYFSDFYTLKSLLKRNPSVAVMRRLEYEYYFRNNNSEYILLPLKDSESCYVLLVEEETLAATPEMQNFIHFLQTEFQKNA